MDNERTARIEHDRNARESNRRLAEESLQTGAKPSGTTSPTPIGTKTNGSANDNANTASGGRGTNSEQSRTNNDSGRTVTARTGTAKQAAKAASSAVPFDQVSEDSKPTKKTPSAKKADKLVESSQAAAFLMQAADMAAGSLIGPDGAMNPIEQMMIEPPLTRILNRLPASTIDRFGGIMDPLMLGAGILWWANRLRIVAANKRAANAPKPVSASPGARLSTQPAAVDVKHDTTDVNGFVSESLANLVSAT